ncbi:MAG: hypothetical protein PHQ23_08565 [Candidatus Wallbacteria bacterium]|nr:hypothetical protein [Candidatus Wallbacteria bacterium]
MTESQGIITFFYPARKDVDKAYEKFCGIASGPPVYNEKYLIYHFFGRDPESRLLEFQCFLHELPHLSFNR